MTFSLSGWIEYLHACLKCIAFHSKFSAGGDTSEYAEVLGKSILFFEAQRSGALPGDNRIPWRGDSATGDGQDRGLDLTEGWYDGELIKYLYFQGYTSLGLIYL